MPADNHITYTARKVGDYECSQRAAPPGADWGIDYGYCRSSLDHHPAHFKQGSSDPRCPADCKHKAPQKVAEFFMKKYAWHGNQEAAKWAREVKQKGL